MVNIITLDMLIEKEACQKQVDLFKQYFGKSVEITEEICIKYSNEFHIEWLVNNMLNEEQCELYHTIQVPAYAAYNAIQGPVLEKYLAIQEPAYEAYKAIHGLTWKEYKDIQWPAYKEYKAIEGPAYEAYNKEKARAFYIVYNS